MTYTTNEIKDFALTLPVTQIARRTAQQFASQQPTSEKAEQVRLNTLAVYVVNDYLQMMGIPTDLSASDSWNRVLRLCANVADLEVTGVGRLECRPIRAFEQTYHIPPEVWGDRIGYVVVQIDESFREATMLGFAKMAVAEQLPVNQLQPFEDLLDCLAASPVDDSRTVVNLSQWLQNVFETGWQTVEALLNPIGPNLAFGFRSELSALGETDDDLSDASVRQAKLIDLGMDIGGHPVALIVEVRSESEQETNILLQVQPTGSQTYLPPQLELIVLDDSKAIFLKAQARSADNHIQLEFSGNPGEQFSVKVALGDASVTEDFVI